MGIFDVSKANKISAEQASGREVLMAYLLETEEIVAAQRHCC